MPEEINHARRFLLRSFFAGSAITFAAADLGIIGPGDARSSKDDLAGATPIQLTTQTQRKDRRMEHPTLYRTMQIDGLSIFYREAGPKDAPTLLLLHGLPSSSRMFEPLFARLSDTFHLVAPDYPGFGHSDWPDPKKFAYTFDHIAEIMDHFTEALGISQYTLYMQDYGGPVGFRMVLAHPERAKALIVQDAVAHNTGLGENWKTRRVFGRIATPMKAPYAEISCRLKPPRRATRATIPTWNATTRISGWMNFIFSTCRARPIFKATSSTTTELTSTPTPSGRRGCARNSRIYW
jgi:pimeloyl-ACP methyl ester carboxylesterase